MLVSEIHKGDFIAHMANPAAKWEVYFVSDKYVMARTVFGKDDKRTILLKEDALENWTGWKEVVPVKLRLSVSLMNMWLEERLDDMGNFYLRLPREHVSEATRLGIEFDEYTQKHIIENKALPPELGGKKLNFPEPKVKLVVPYNNLIDVVAELDCLDGSDIYEFKRSIPRDSVDWSQSLQCDWYLMIAMLAKEKGVYPLVHKFENPLNLQLYRFDPSHKTYDRTQLWMSPRRVSNAVNLIEQHGENIYQYLKGAGIL